MADSQVDEILEIVEEVTVDLVEIIQDLFGEDVESLRVQQEIQAALNQAATEEIDAA